MLQEEGKRKPGYNPIHECHFWEERDLAASSLLWCRVWAMVIIHLRAACSNEQGGTVCSSPTDLGTHHVAVIPSQRPIAARALRGGQAGRRDRKTRYRLLEVNYLAVVASTARKNCCTDQGIQVCRNRLCHAGQVSVA